MILPNPQGDRSGVSTLGKLPYVATNPKTDQGMPKPGDAVVVCRPDGSSSFFLLDIDHKALLAKLSEGADMTAMELGQLDAAHKAMTLCLVGKNAKLLSALTEMVNEPGFLNSEEIAPLN